MGSNFIRTSHRIKIRDWLKNSRPNNWISFISWLSYIFLHCTFTFQIKKDSVMIYKGTESDIDAYSSFFDNQRLKETKLRHELTKRGVTDVYVAGIATDVCVGKYRVSKTNFLQEIQVLKLKLCNLSFIKKWSWTPFSIQKTWERRKRYKWISWYSGTTQYFVQSSVYLEQHSIPFWTCQKDSLLNTTVK